MRVGMKIHEKILTHYLSCPSPVDREGYLFKKKKRNTSYQRRWFVLKANLLFYQERPADRHLLGVIVLEGCAVRRCESEGQFSFSLVFEGPGLKTYRFAAVDHRTQESWVTSLLSASHCYLSLLVRDLGRQYEEAKQHSGESPPSTSTGALKQSSSQINQGFFFQMQEPPAAVREGTRLSVGTVSQTKKSPKLWHRRNAHVTPLNSPAPLYGEWPLVGFDPLEEFSKLHEYYGQEVKKAREEWLQNRQEKEEEDEEEEDEDEEDSSGDLIELG